MERGHKLRLAIQAWVADNPGSRMADIIQAFKQCQSAGSVGMYEVADPTYPQVKIGKYTICRQDEKSVWIQTDDGETGEQREWIVRGEAMPTAFDGHLE